jgi:7-carboxy-7-deazaguanine synthase
MLRLLEHYVSPQGEGPRVGIMSQFVRFAGCNLRCPLWPCDTPYAIEPAQFKDEQEYVTVPELINRIEVLASSTGANNIVFTGGEPLLQPQQDLVHVLVALTEEMPKLSFEIFSNGTLPIDERLPMLANFVMDWKLPGSGENPDNEQRIKNLDLISETRHSVKFTIRNQADLEMASGIWCSHLWNRDIQVFAGPVWNTMAPVHIVEFIKKRCLPWRLNIQVHNYVFGAQRRGI